MSRRLAFALAAVIATVVAMMGIGRFIAAPLAIRSDAMRPGLMAGDMLLVRKATPGWVPPRGEIVVFHDPASDGQRVVRRVVGVPGDRVALRDGRLILNGRQVPRWRVADYVVPVTSSDACPAERRLVDARSRPACSTRRYRQMLPGGRTFDLLDPAPADRTDVAERVAPSGHVLAEADNPGRADAARALFPSPL